MTTNDRYSLHVFHDKVGKWMRLRHGMTAVAAAGEMIERQDRLRRRKEPCRVVVLPDGQEPQ